MVKWIKKLFYILVSVTILAVGINMFLAPHHIAAGGITGLAIILEALFGFNRSLVVMIFNIGILGLTFIFLGKTIFLNTVIGAILLPIMMDIVPRISLLDDVLMAVIFGSAIFGVGVAILYANEASSGGTSIPPLILKKYFNINPSVGLLITDSIVVILSIFVFGVESFFYAIFSIIITSATINYLEVGLNKRKALFIVSDKHKEILEALLHELNHGVTVIPVRGGYSGQDKEMLMVTLSARYYQSVIATINKFDEKAFVITYAVTDVHGLGFTYESAAV